VARFEELYAKFQRTKSLTKSNAMMHLLLQLANDPKVTRSENGNQNEIQLAQGTVVESVFASKLNNQVSYPHGMQSGQSR
jgi:hypothetical protein